MKRIVFSVLMFLSPLMAEAQELGAGEMSFHYQTNETISRLFTQGYFYSSDRPNFGGWGWIYHEPGYTSFTVGPFWDIGEYVSVGAAIGSEFFTLDSAEHTLGRYSLTAFIGTETSSAEYYYENGSSKVSWSRLDLQFWGNRTIALGAIAQTGDGLGPRVRFGLPLGEERDLRIWVASMKNSRGNNLLVEINLVAAFKAR